MDRRPLDALVALVTDRATIKKNPSGRYVGLEHLATASPDLQGWGRSDSSVSTNTVFKKDDVLFGKLRPNLRKSVLAPFDGYCSTDILVLRSRPGAMPAFVAKVFESDEVVAAAVRSSIGTRMPRTSWADLKNVTVFAPDESEQLGISRALGAIDEAVRSTQRTIAKLQLMKQGLLQNVLTRGIDDNGELRDPAGRPEEFKESALGSVPKGWTVSTASDVCRRIEVGIVIRPAQYYVSSGVPMLRSANVRENGIDLNDLVFMSEVAHARLQKSAVSPGDVVTVRTGYPGTSAVVPETLPTANCVDIIISRPGPRIRADFLAHWINSEHGKGQVLRSQGGLAQQHFNVGALKRLLVPVPSPPEQERISLVVKAATERLECESALAQKLARVKVGLAEDLLSGRIRVTSLAEAWTA